MGSVRPRPSLAPAAGDDPHVDSRRGGLASAAAAAAPAAAPSPRRGSRLADHDVGGARARGPPRAAPSTRSSLSSIRRLAPSTEARWRSAVTCRSDLPLDRARSGGFTQSRSRPVPSRCAERQARRTSRWEEGCGRTRASSALADRLRRARSTTRSSRVPSGSSTTRRFASTSWATWRSATSRSDSRFSTVKKLFSAALDVLARVDLAGAQALDQRLGGEVDQHHLVGLAEHGVGDRLADPGAGQLGDLVVERLEVLDVDGREDVDSGREHVARRPRSASRARPRARWCGRARRSAPARARGRSSAGRSISSSSVSR